MTLKVFWYRCGRGHGNFGDVLTPLLLDYFNVRCEWAPAEKADLAGIGSICEKIPADFRGVIWSSGNLRETHRNHFPAARVVALRGKLTHERTTCAANADIVLGDGGLLCNLLAPQVRKRYKLGIIPHYVDQDHEVLQDLAKRSRDICLIDICDEPRVLIQNVAQCEFILSSSLHGLVLADSLGIPNRWLQAYGDVLGEGFKFRDYYSVYEIDRPEPLVIRTTDSLETLLPQIGSYHRPGIERIQANLLDRLKGVLGGCWPVRTGASDTPLHRAARLKQQPDHAKRNDNSQRVMVTDTGAVADDDWVTGKPIEFAAMTDDTTLFSHENLGELIFGQPHILTQSFLLQRFGQFHSVELHDLPHYSFLRDNLESPFEDHAYAEYLACSWSYYRGPEGNTPEERRRRIFQYLQLYNDIDSRRHNSGDAIDEPLTLCRRPDGRTVIVDGNHRATIAHYLRLDVPVRFVDLGTQLARVVAVPDEYYGTARLARPYQSVFHRGTELVFGRRRDLQTRMDLVFSGDLVNKVVLDLGCNLGTNCYLAAERGAAAAIGIEKLPAVASAAVRLNAYLAAPCYFIAHDLDQELEVVPQADTVFCFSLLAHLASASALLKTISRSGCSVVYFEGHAASTANDYECFLKADLFSGVELIGHTHDGVHTVRKTRPLFRCIVKNRARNQGAPVAYSGQNLASQFSVEGPAWKTSTRAVRDAHHADSRPLKVEELESVIPEGEAFIFVDGGLGIERAEDLTATRRMVRFLERNGDDWGPPADDEQAIEELETLRLGGAGFIVFAWPAFWWLDYYAGFHRHLDDSYPCVLASDALIVFDIRIKQANEALR